MTPNDKDHPIVHAIRAWSGKTVDESPLCGVNKDHHDVWHNRTIFNHAVTCPICLIKLKEKDSCHPTTRTT